MLQRCILAVATFALLPGTNSRPEHMKPDTASTFRWSSSALNCSREDRNDGKFLYTLETPEARFTVMVDGAELEKSHRTAERIFTLHLAVLLLGRGPLTIRPDQTALQLVRHHGVWLSPLEPDTLAKRIQTETAELAVQTARYVEKHPEKQTAMREHLGEQQKLAAQWIDFLNTQSLPDETIKALSPRTSGWIYFPAESNGVRSWKSREEFVFRISLPGCVVEFPFRLPPADSPILMHRLD